MASGHGSLFGGDERFSTILGPICPKPGSQLTRALEQGPEQQCCVPLPFPLPWSLSCDPQAATAPPGLVDRVHTVFLSRIHTPCSCLSPGSTATSGQGAASHIQMKWIY
ncbi:hypothetical protein MC885_008297 [Smutsia gigantea]|nr:hypothetical protein MC885_008297 [Smutsia gigantea]